MKTTDYPGIDYSHGQANIDPATGIRYGMIAQNSLMSEVLDDVFSNGTDLGFEQAETELKHKLRSTLDDYYHGSRLDRAVERAFDSLDGWADGIDSNGPWSYESDGLTVQTTDDGNLWVFASPFYTHAQFCSPCVPGAGNLDAPCPDGPKTYCLGHDWFDGGVAPYPVYSVKTSELVMPMTQ